jgi:hypothetical protein
MPMPMPTPGVQVLGGHPVLAVGYDNAQAFTVAQLPGAN